MPECAGALWVAWSTLRRYERARKGNNLEMLALMDLFKRVFSNNNQALTLLRNLGLNLADASGPLKRILVRRAMGLTGELPSLAGSSFQCINRDHMRFLLSLLSKEIRNEQYTNRA